MVLLQKSLFATRQTLKSAGALFKLGSDFLMQVDQIEASISSLLEKFPEAIESGHQQHTQLKELLTKKKQLLTNQINLLRKQKDRNDIKDEILDLQEEIRRCSLSDYQDAFRKSIRSANEKAVALAADKFEEICKTILWINPFYHKISSLIISKQITTVEQLLRQIDRLEISYSHQYSNPQHAEKHLNAQPFNNEHGWLAKFTAQDERIHNKLVSDFHKFLSNPTLININLADSAFIKALDEFKQQHINISSPSKTPQTISSGIMGEELDTINKSYAEDFINRIIQPYNIPPQKKLTLAGPSVMRHKVKTEGADVAENDEEVYKAQLHNMHLFHKNINPSDLVSLTERISNLDSLHKKDALELIKDKSNSPDRYDYIDWDTNKGMFTLDTKTKEPLSEQFWKNIKEIQPDNRPKFIEFATAESLRKKGNYKLQNMIRALEGINLTEEQYEALDDTSKIEAIVEMVKKEGSRLAATAGYKLIAQTFYRGKTSPTNHLIQLSEDVNILNKVKQAPNFLQQIVFLAELLNASDAKLYVVPSLSGGIRGVPYIVYGSAERFQQTHKDYVEVKSRQPKQLARDLLNLGVDHLLSKLSIWKQDLLPSSGGDTFMVHQLYSNQQITQRPIHRTLDQVSKQREKYLNKLPQQIKQKQTQLNPSTNQNNLLTSIREARLSVKLALASTHK